MQGRHNKRCRPWFLWRILEGSAEVLAVPKYQRAGCKDNSRREWTAESSGRPLSFFLPLIKSKKMERTFVTIKDGERMVYFETRYVAVKFALKLRALVDGVSLYEEDDMTGEMKEILSF